MTPSVPYLHTSRGILSHPPTPRPPRFPSSGHLTDDDDNAYLHVHAILIVIIFCSVCFLLLVAFFYAFCFHCTLRPAPKDGRPGTAAFHLEREDATFRRSSSCPSLGNAI